MGNDTRYQVYAYAHKKKKNWHFEPQNGDLDKFPFNRSDVQVLAVDFQVIIDWSGLIMKLSKHLKITGANPIDMHRPVAVINSSKNSDFTSTWWEDVEVDN